MQRRTLAVVRVASGTITHSITYNTPAIDAAHIAVTRDNACSTFITDIVNDTIPGSTLTIRITSSTVTRSTLAIGISSDTPAHYAAYSTLFDVK